MPIVRGSIARRALLLLVLAAAGAAAAAVLTRSSDGAPAVVRALGGSVTVKPGGTGAEPLTAWPGKPGWTIVLVSVPKADGRDEALALAEAARARGLPDVGILDASRYASVRPGYWLVFTGVYASEAEATGSLRAARALRKTARVQRIAR